MLLRTTTAARRPMDAILRGCQGIMQQHRSGQTEAFYQRMLEIELYHRGIPCLREVDCFAMSGAVPVLVGRIDLEVDHSTILELKVGNRILPKHVQQLLRYVRARQATGMKVEHAAVICFTDADTVLVREEDPRPHVIARRSRFFAGKR
jgi:GxxExxY protein